jgi:hypothetical protein
VCVSVVVVVVVAVVILLFYFDTCISWERTDVDLTFHVCSSVWPSQIEAQTSFETEEALCSYLLGLHGFYRQAYLRVDAAIPLVHHSLSVLHEKRTTFLERKTSTRAEDHNVKHLQGYLLFRAGNSSSMVRVEHVRQTPSLRGAYSL